MRSKDGLRPCARVCREKNKNCTKTECRMWIEYSADYNCTLVAVYEQGRMTLREVAERTGVSFARIKQIESAALKKLKKRLDISSLLF